MRMVMLVSSTALRMIMAVLRILIILTIIRIMIIKGPDGLEWCLEGPWDTWSEDLEAPRGARLGSGKARKGWSGAWKGHWKGWSRVWEDPGH